jgi:Tol biopolymer transport system component
MTQADDFTLVVQRYLDGYQGSTPLPASVREAVLGRLPTVKQHRARRWTVGRPPGGHVVEVTMAAAAVVAAIAVVAVNLAPARELGTGSSAPGSDLGVFEPARGWVVFMSAGHLVAVDPLDPSSSIVIEPAGLDLGTDVMPAGWSADGAKLALTIEGVARYVMDQTGTLERVAVEELPDVQSGCCEFVTSAWLSPDGTEGLAFSSSGGRDLDPGKLYVLDLEDVEHSRAVTVEAFEWARGPFFEGPKPVWSPDGTEVAYVWSKGADIATPAVGIVDLATGASRELVSGWSQIRQLAWSPDGSQMLVVAGDHDPGYRGELNPLTHPQPASLFVVDIDDAEAREIASGHYVAAAWSPDGSQIAAVDYPGSREVVVLQVDGSGEPVVLAELPPGGLFTGVVWHPVPAP